MISGYDALLPRHEVLRRIADEHGRPDPFRWPGSDPTGDDRFAGLVLHVVSQQIATAAALTVFGRLRDATGPGPTAAAVLAVGPAGLRAMGLSTAKSSTILQVAGRVQRGDLDPGALDQLDDDDVLDALQRVPGIGRWTAEMFLIHQLRRPDVLPAADLAIRRGVQLAWRLPSVPSEPAVRRRGDQWAPWRTYAAALIWASLRPREAAGVLAREVTSRRPDRAPGAPAGCANPAAEGWTGRG